MELREAVRAFERNHEYNSAAIRPFASRLDGAIDIGGAPLYIEEWGDRARTDKHDRELPTS
jgi:hypothetical protein